MSALAKYSTTKETNGTLNVFHYHHVKTLSTGTRSVEFFRGVDDANDVICNLGANSKLPSGQSFSVMGLLFKLHPPVGGAFTLAGIQAVKDWLSASILDYALNTQLQSQYVLSSLGSMFSAPFSTGDTNTEVSGLGVNPDQRIDLSPAPHTWPENGSFQYTLESNIALASEANGYRIEIICEGFRSMLNASQVQV